MAPITRHYGITTPVPFVDVDVNVDNAIFIDPYAIRLDRSANPFAAQANFYTETYFREVTRCALSRNGFDRQTGLRLLQRFIEPWETRLGLASNSFSGHGGAEEVGTWIWNTLTTDVEALLRVGLLRQIENLPLFVEGIDRDITSDITTRIIFESLADFTATMMTRYPQFAASGHRVGAFERQVWDPHNREWTTKVFDLPVAAGKPLLLVPRSWARKTLLMSAGRYYETSVLSYAQLEQAVLSSTGKLLTTPKYELRKQNGLGRGRNTNLSVTFRAHKNDDDLLSLFKSFVDARWERTDQSQQVA
ncbi:hypothetical protein JXX30_00385 [Rhodococcus erythropolis]|uniref:hypothetical protein n=1 Tax=Rhodococcus erythropolis TaxID=1833 RepID=UPI0019818565|nr:hypothetical protein [Rhodococcus erythropolis]QSE41332.1 hypothetical protein JXX30_00385 [Rhodococcus erythropolis]